MQRFAYQPGIASEDVDLILARMPTPVWDALRGQRIFITGGTGFVGCWLLEALLAGHEHFDLGLQLTVLSRDPHRFTDRAPHLARHPAVEMLAGDMRDLSHVHRTFDIIIHAATDVVAPDADPVRAFDAIVEGTRQVIALRQRTGARKMLLTSSGAVYGRQPAVLETLPESWQGAPDTMDTRSAYGHAKRISEWLLACAAREQAFDLQTARCFAFTGAYLPLDAQFAIGNFIGAVLRGESVQVGGDGTPFRSYLYAADMAVWLLAILMQGDGQPYNVGSEHAVSIAALAHLVSITLTGEDSVHIAQRPQPGAKPQRYIPSVERARALGLHEYTDLPTAIAKTAEWHQRHQPGPHHGS